MSLPSVSHGLAPVRTVLPNGVAVIAKDTRKTAAVTINVALRAGSIGDPPGLDGATFLLSRVIDRGTTTRSADDIAEALESRGVSLSVGVTRHVFSVSCTCLSADFPEVFAVLSDIIRHPRVPETELRTRKGEVATGLRQDEDNPAVRASDALMAQLYGATHPYGRPAKGTLDTVDRLSPNDLLNVHRAGFVPGATSVVIVGAVSTSHAVEVVHAGLGSWHASQGPAIPLPAPERARSRRRHVISMMNKAQADIAYGFTTMTRHDPDYYAFSLLNNVFGQYALGGRLGDSIRERQGMAYYVYSSFDANVAPGPLVVRAGVSGANVDRAIASIDEEIAVLVREGPTAKEHKESTDYLIGSLPRSLETNAGIAHFLQTAEFFGLGMNHDLELPGLLRAVTFDQIKEVATRYLDPGVATVVVAGPYADTQD
jgi:zinc protease